MRTEPCPNCGTELLRDDSPGLLVCGVCKEVVEFPSDLEGSINPAPDDSRWFGTTSEQEDAAALAQLQERVSRQAQEEPVEEGRPLSAVDLDRALADFERRRRYGDD